MRIAIRANASDSIGAGHVIRQLAFCQYLMNRGVPFDLFASIPGPEWLITVVRNQLGTRWKEVEEKDFGPGQFEGEEYYALVIDSYDLEQGSLDLLQRHIPRVAVIVDGPWQSLRGQVGIAPVLLGNRPWINTYKSRFQSFHHGPGYFMLRKEVVSASLQSRKLIRPAMPRIVVSLGGAQEGKPLRQIIRVLEDLEGPFQVDVFSRNQMQLSLPPQNKETIFSFHPPGSNFLGALASSSFAITAAGTTVAELLFLGVPAIYIPVANNQRENIIAIKELELGPILSPHPFFFRKRLSSVVRSTIIAEPDFNRRQLIDELGSARVLEAILGPLEAKFFQP